MSDLEADMRLMAVVIPATAAFVWLAWQVVLFLDWLERVTGVPVI